MSISKDETISYLRNLCYMLFNAGYAASDISSEIDALESNFSWTVAASISDRLCSLLVQYPELRSAPEISESMFDIELWSAEISCEADKCNRRNRGKSRPRDLDEYER
jgi:hypothetical protein